MALTREQVAVGRKEQLEKWKTDFSVPCGIVKRRKLPQAVKRVPGADPIKAKIESSILCFSQPSLLTPSYRIILCVGLQAMLHLSYRKDLIGEQCYRPSFLCGNCVTII